MALAENKSREDTFTGNYTLANNNTHVGGKMEFIEKLKWRRPPFRVAGSSLVYLLAFTRLLACLPLLDLLTK